jgi:hypothetical protein
MKTEEIKITKYKGEGLSVIVNVKDIKNVMLMMGNALGEIADKLEKDDDEFSKEMFINGVKNCALLPKNIRQVSYSLFIDNDEND